MVVETVGIVGSIISPLLLAVLLYKIWKLEFKFTRLPCKPCGGKKNEKPKKSG